MLLGPDEPPPYGVVNPDGASDILLICEHASPAIPRALGDLGLSEAERRRHIGWDIGALDMALDLSARLDATLVHSNWSRLVVDCNRPLDRPSLIPETSEVTRVPGNLGLSAAERARRIDALFRPFHEAIAERIEARQTAGRATIVVGLHSFTPVYKGVARPWHAGILYAAARPLAQRLIAALSQPGLVIGENEPYRIDRDDYTVPVHGDARGLPAVLVEIRNDLIADPAGASAWAGRLAAALG